MRNHGALYRYLTEALILLALAVLVALPWGCSQSPPTYSVPPVENTFTLPNGLIAYPGVKHDETEVMDAENLGLVPVTFEPLDDKNAEDLGTFGESLDDNGGIIFLDLEGEVSYFTVPDGALNKSAEIQVRVLRDESALDRRITEFHFGPKGLAFEKPAELSYRTSMKDGETLPLFWYHPEKAAWVLAARAVVVDGYATFPIEHFSDYRTTERISLGGQRRAD